MRKPIVAALGAALALLIAAPAVLADAAHHAAAPKFKALHWRVSIAGSASGTQIETVKSGGTATLCNMDRLNELEIDYSYKNTGGQHFTLIISGLGGPSIKAPFMTKHSHGKAVSGYSANALPGYQSPAPAGTYGAQVRKGAKTLMRARITLASSNTCS